MGPSPHLARAYELARRHHTHPNPRVGAVVVDPSGAVIGEGAHVGPGHAHAEVVALDEAGDAAGATLFVSLEPCTFQGRTPPCVDRVIASGVSKVVIGTIDPDSRVSGSGIAILEEAGIDVELVDDPEARALDRAYFHHRETGRAMVVAKYAMTLDGAVSASDGTSQWITSETARRDAHALRAEFDAVVIGSGTLASDDPRLDVRLDGFDGPQPRPVLVAGSGELPQSAQVWERRPLVVSSSERPIPAGDLVIVPGEDDHPNPLETCRALAEAGFLSLLLEGGPRLTGAWWRAGVIDAGVVYVGARVGGGVGMSPLYGVFGSIDDASDVVITSARVVGGDVRIGFERDT